MPCLDQITIEIILLTSAFPEDRKPKESNACYAPPIIDPICKHPEEVVAAAVLDNTQETMVDVSYVDGHDCNTIA